MNQKNHVNAVKWKGLDGEYNVDMPSVVFMGVTSCDPDQWAEPVKSAAPQTKIENISFTVMNNVIRENMFSKCGDFLAKTLAETFIPLKKWREEAKKCKFCYWGNCGWEAILGGNSCQVERQRCNDRNTTIPRLPSGRVSKYKSTHSVWTLWMRTRSLSYLTFFFFYHVSPLKLTLLSCGFGSLKNTNTNPEPRNLSCRRRANSLISRSLAMSTQKQFDIVVCKLVLSISLT